VGDSFRPISEARPVQWPSSDVKPELAHDSGYWADSTL
jgi:hypothetical protein